MESGGELKLTITSKKATSLLLVVISTRLLAFFQRGEAVGMYDE